MNKYRNIKVEVDGIRFDSRREANYYGILKMRKLAGEILTFDMQIPYPIRINEVLICNYVADFVVMEKVTEGRYEQRIIDVKGIKTPVYKLKKKLMKAVYGIDIIEL